MTCRRLLFVFCCCGVLAVTRCIAATGYLCVSDFWYNITCTLNITGNPAGESDPTYSLKFREPDGADEVSCPLTVVNHGYSCSCKVKTNELHFASFHCYDISLCDKSDCCFVTESFYPFKNIKLTPPPEPELQQTTETSNITCKSGYEDHFYLNDELDCELELQIPHSKESKSLPLLSSEKFYQINKKSQLRPGAEYCVKARHRPKPSSDYAGNWSEWSKSTCWKNEAGGETSSKQDSIFLILAKSVGAVCVFVGVLLFVFYSPAARMKIKTLSHTPSPAPFFQPLYQQHAGNLQEWLSPQGTFLLPCKTEEILMTNAVTVVPKLITTDPEENQVLHDPAVTPLVFTQCQSSYVGLPEVHKASPPVTVTCPGDAHYTQHPSSGWGFNTAEEVAFSLPKDFLEISHADSGCSCEHLTQSPECSLPNSPTDDSPPLCPCDNYCILNKTSEGVVPVLVSKESSKTCPSELHEALIC